MAGDATAGNQLTCPLDWNNTRRLQFIQAGFTTACLGFFKEVFLWSKKSLGGHSVHGIETDIWISAVRYQKLVEAADKLMRDHYGRPG